jgi:hypothetical protein
LPRYPLPPGTWGEIFVKVISRDGRGRAVRYEAKTRFRDVDGTTRQVAAWGRTESGAKNKLRANLRERVRREGSTELKSTDRISVAIDLFLRDVEVKVEDVGERRGRMRHICIRFRKTCALA